MAFIVVSTSVLVNLLCTNVSFGYYQIFIVFILAFNHLSFTACSIVLYPFESISMNPVLNPLLFEKPALHFNSNAPFSFYP